MSTVIKLATLRKLLAESKRATYGGSYVTAINGLLNIELPDGRAQIEIPKHHNFYTLASEFVSSIKGHKGNIVFTDANIYTDTGDVFPTRLEQPTRSINNDKIIVPVDTDTRTVNLQALKAATLSAAYKDVRYYLNGVVVCPDSVASTDGHRLYCSKAKPCDQVDYTIPTAICRLLSAICKDDLQIGFAGVESSRAAFVSLPGGWNLQTKCVDGKYPNLRQVTPDYTARTSFVIDKKILSNACKTFKPLADKEYPGLTIKVCDGHIKLGHNGKIATQPIRVPCEGEFLETLGLNIDYVIDACKQIQGDTLTLWLEDHHSPAVFTGDCESYALIMPMRL